MSTSLERRGPRVVLRDWVPEDLPRYREFQRPDQEWQRLDGPYYRRSTPDEIDLFLERLEERIVAGDWPNPRQVVAIAAGDTNELIGRVNRYWQSEETQWLSIGIVIYDDATWGQGLGYEALGLWCDYLLETMPELVRLDLRTWSGNLGMMRLAEKLGFREEARFRKARVVEGRHYDGMGYGVLREEWNDRYPAGFLASL